MAPVVMKQLAAGCQLEDGPTGHRLAWPTGEATFYHRYEALTFSWVIDADPNTILGSYRHPNGEPLFDLGVPVDRWTPADTGARMRPTRVVEPRIEIPPPDDEGAADRAAIDAVLADLGWQRQAPSGAQVFAVGDRFMGRAVAYRQSQFVYESTVPPDHRSARCSFSTAAAARQWLVTDLGSILRTRTLMPKIQPNRLGPLCTLERTPTGWDLVWSEGRASFPLGIGHLLAMTFSWVAGAELAEIVASFRHRNGEPLFDLGQPSQPAAE